MLVAGSALTGTTDVHSDIDLVIVCAEPAYAAVMASRREFAESLGPLLSAFTGEHVGEPRLLICLYDSPLLHVDLKFITTAGLATRVETPQLLFDRSGAVAPALSAGTAEWPSRPPEWFEERFWIWAHYGATKIARGELFEAIDLLTWIRGQVLGPMLARNLGRQQRGVRRVEQWSAEGTAQLTGTLAKHDAADCRRALHASIALYRELRRPCLPANENARAEAAVVAFVAAMN